MIAAPARQQLRDYQERAVESVIATLDRRPILVSPTGSGKTTMATEIVERLDRPTLWLAHRKELIDQAAAKRTQLPLANYSQTEKETST